MKAAVVEIRNNYVSVLTDDGSVVKIRNADYEIGQIIQVSHPLRSIVKKVVAFTASAAAVLVLGIGTWAYASPYSYVSLDINPSIEYSINRFDRVLSVKAVNDDGEEIIREIHLNNLKNKKIWEALTTTVAKISEAGYFEGSEGGIVITASAKDQERADELVQDLQQAVEEEVSENGDTIEVEAMSVAPERVKEAQKLGVTPGKLNLVEKLMESSPDPASIIVEEWINKPVKEIMKATKNNKEMLRNAGKEDGSDGDQVQSLDNAKDNAAVLNEGQNKAGKLQEKADKKAAKAQEKANKNQEKADVKADKDRDKAQEKADKDRDKTQEKDDKNRNKAQEKEDKDRDKAQEKDDKSRDKPQEKADKDRDKTQEKDDKDRDKAQEKEDKDRDKAQEKDEKNRDKAQEKNDKNPSKAGNEPDKDITSRNQNDSGKSDSAELSDKPTGSSSENGKTSENRNDTKTETGSNNNNSGKTNAGNNDNDSEKTNAGSNGNDSEKSNTSNNGNDSKKSNTGNNGNGSEKSNTGNNGNGSEKTNTGTGKNNGKK